MESDIAGTPPRIDAVPAADPEAAPRHWGGTLLRHLPALGIRAQLALVLTVFLALPWLGFQYAREIERFLQAAQDRALAGTAQAISTALNDRPQLFDAPPDPIASFARERIADEGAGGVTLPPSASPEIEQIIRGLSRIDARIWVVDRDLTVLAHTGSLRREPPPDVTAPSSLDALWQGVERATLGRLYQRVLVQPTEDFRDEAAVQGPPRGRDIEGALAGILTTDRRRTLDGKAIVVAAASPIWIGDQVRGAVVVEQTTNRVLAERNLAFERLFNIVLAVLLLGSVALTLFASRLSSRIRQLRDAAEAAIDPDGRSRSPFAGSDARDEIGDLSRSFASVLARLSEYAAYQEKLAGRLSHELRTPIAVVRSSLENLQQQPHDASTRIYLERAQGGLTRLSSILTRMTEAAHLDQALQEAERERYDVMPVVAACVDGYRFAYPGVPFDLSAAEGPMVVLGAPDLLAQLLDKLVSNAVEFRSGETIGVSVERAGDTLRLTVSNAGPRLPSGMPSRLFDSMVSVRPPGKGAHLGLGLYVARMIAQFHGGSIDVADRVDQSGVVVTLRLPLASR
jgi:dedicated sortase system histidine kinase